MLKKVAYVALAGLTVASSGALAATDSTTMAVSASISASCVISANPLNFGALTSTNAGVTNAATTVDVTCSSESPFNVGIDYGVNTLGFSTRRMASGPSNFMIYNVYTSNAYTTAFGPVSTYGDSSNYNSSGTTIGTTTIDVFGQIPIQTTPPSGAYADTLTVSVNY